jgi:hypothetical protein
MHLNRNKPNILSDMIAAANGHDLRDGDRIPRADGRATVVPSAKRWRVPRKDYRHCKDAQVLKAETGN